MVEGCSSVFSAASNGKFTGTRQIAAPNPLKAITLHEIRTGTSHLQPGSMENDRLDTREEPLKPDLPADIASEDIPLLERILRLGHMTAAEAAIFWGTPRTSTHEMPPLGSLRRATLTQLRKLFLTPGSR
jgi:hypothetical protein